jgi:hypothetical protein
VGRREKSRTAWHFVEKTENCYETRGKKEGWKERRLNEKFEETSNTDGGNEIRKVSNELF